MRSMLSLLTILSLAACAGGSAVLEADASAARLRPTDFNDPECISEYIDTVQAIYSDYQFWLDQTKEGLFDEYQDLQQRGASQDELEAYQDMAREELAAVRAQRDRALADFEQQVCGGDPIPCDPSQENCGPVCDPDAGDACPPDCADPTDCPPPPPSCDDPSNPDDCPPPPCDDPSDPDGCNPQDPNSP